MWICKSCNITFRELLCQGVWHSAIMCVPRRKMSSFFRAYRRIGLIQMSAWLMTTCHHLDTITAQDITALTILYNFIYILCCMTFVGRIASRKTNNLRCIIPYFNLLKPTGHVMHQQFNIQQLYVLPTLYFCVLYLSENKQRLVPLTA